MFKKIAIVITFLLFCLSLPGYVSAENLKIGYINMRKVFFEYNKTKEFNKKLEKEDAAAKEEIEKRTQKIRKLRDEIDLLSDDAKEKRQPELRQKIQELDEFRRNKIEGFVREKDEMFKEIRQDIINVTDEYAKKNGYDVIFDEAVFVYSSKKYDITSEIIKGLNK